MSEIRIPLGFKTAGVACGIKKTTKDLALIVSDSLAEAAGVYKNQVKGHSLNGPWIKLKTIK